MNAKKIIKEITSVKKKLDSITSMRSGSLSQQYNVCGSPGCKCKDSVSPEKHGPYYKLSTTINGKGTTKFIKKENVEQVKQQLERYKEFNMLIKELVNLARELADIELTTDLIDIKKTKKKNHV
jgi:hypothetical protein